MPSSEMLYCMVQQSSVRKPLAHARRWEHLLSTWQMAPHRLCSQMGQGEAWYPASLLQGRSEIPADRKEIWHTGGDSAQASVTSMFCSWLSRVTSFAFFLLPSCCFFCFLDGSWSMGAGFTNGISSWSPAREESTK